MQTCHRQLRRNNPLKSRCTMLVNIRRKTLAAVKYVNSPDSYSASKLMSRRIELRGNEGGWNNDGTEAYCRGDHTHRRNPRRTGRGAGIGLLLSTRLNNDQRKAAGLALALVGGLTTIPLALGVMGKRATTTEIRPAA